MVDQELIQVQSKIHQFDFPDNFLLNPKEISINPPSTAGKNIDHSLIKINHKDKKDSETLNWKKRKKLRQILSKEDISNASELDKLLQPLHTSLFIESNPSPVKYAASLLGMCKPTVRLPLVEVREETKKKVSEALKVAKLL